MNKEDPYRDQAERLRQKVKFEEGKVVEREELPPRSRVHQTGKKNKWKLKYPVIRLLVLFFILLPITIFSIYSTIAKDRLGEVKKTVGESSEEFETIDIEKPDSNPNKVEENSQEADSTNAEEEVAGSSGNAMNDEQLAGEASIAQQGTGISPAASVTAQTKDTVYHTVKPGETIFRISMKYYKSKSGIDTIKSVNNLQSNEIRVGQVLTIPLNK